MNWKDTVVFWGIIINLVGAVTAWIGFFISVSEHSLPAVTFGWVGAAALLSFNLLALSLFATGQVR